jgi:general secretion pathway protein J
MTRITRASGFTRWNNGPTPPCTSLESARCARGFTLIELLVAIAVFGVLSAMTYRTLTVVLESRGHIERENRKWRDVALFLARLEQDVTAVVPRPVRSTGDLVSPALVAVAAPVRADEGALTLTRTAFAAEPGRAEPPQRLGYRLRNGTVELLGWSVLDQGPRTEPRVVAAVRDVKSMQLRYLDARGQWHFAWPPVDAAAAQQALPGGVEVTLTLASGERVVRLLPTAARTPRQ